MARDMDAIYSLGSPYSADCQRQAGHIENFILYGLQFKHHYFKVIQCPCFYVSKEAITNTEGWRKN